MAFRYKSGGEPPANNYDVLQHARNYVAAMPPAISGQGGHGQTFAVACVLVQGFGLGPLEAWSILKAYNDRCQPPWSEKELWHKLQDAEKAEPPAGGRGCMVAGKGRSPARYHPAVQHAHQFEQFLNACFKPDEIVSIAPGTIPEGEMRAIPEHGGVNLFTREQWLEKVRAAIRYAKRDPRLDDHTNPPEETYSEVLAFNRWCRKMMPKVDSFSRERAAPILDDLREDGRQEASRALMALQTEALGSYAVWDKKAGQRLEQLRSSLENSTTIPKPVDGEGIANILRSWG